MPKVKSTGSKTKVRKAMTTEGRENQLIAMAMDLVEQRLLDGTASSQETTHFLKLGSSKTALELEKLKAENKLLQAKKEALEEAAESKVAYDEVIRALKSYSGHGEDDEDEYY